MDGQHCCPRKRILDFQDPGSTVEVLPPTIPSRSTEEDVSLQEGKEKSQQRPKTRRRDVFLSMVNLGYLCPDATKVR
jgi:hypothetical protein